jgi:hypothetical protein
VAAGGVSSGNQIQCAPANVSIPVSVGAALADGGGGSSIAASAAATMTRREWAMRFSSVGEKPRIGSHAFKRFNALALRA